MALPADRGHDKTLASELLTVRGGRIVEIRLAFDRPGHIPTEEQPT